MPRTPANVRKARETSDVASAVKQRKAALEQMTPPLRKVFDQIDDSFSQQHADSIRFYHDVGKLLKVIKDNEEQYVGEDGTPGIALVTQAMNVRGRTLTKAMQFATLVDDNELVELVGLYDEATNFSLHWGHIAFLITVPTKTNRIRYAKEAIRGLMSPDELHTFIKEAEGREGGHGRSHKIPDSVEKQVAQVAKLSKQWCDKDENVWHCAANNIITNVLNTPEVDLNEKLLTDVKATGEYLRKMRDRAEELIAEYDRVEVYVDASLAKQAEEDATIVEARETNVRRNARRTRAVDVS